MIKLRPHRRYSLLYQDGSTIRFETLEHIPEAKHLIQVRDLKTGEVTDFVDLLLKPWVDIIDEASGE